MKRKLVAVLLAAMLIVTMLPTVALADGTINERVFQEKVRPLGYNVNIFSYTTYQSTREQGGSISDNRIWGSSLWSQGSWTFTATPKSGYEFVGWTTNGPDGVFSVSGNALTVTYKDNSRNYEATATFRYLPRYTLDTSATAGGSVTKSPSQGSYARGDSVTLTAVPAGGYYFAGWTGDLSGTTNPASVTMNANKTVGATFALLPTYSLNISVSPDGVGSVSKSPDVASYWQGRNVTLTANVPGGYRFAGWSGDITSGSNPTSFPVTGNMAVTANFVKQYNITLNTSGGGELDHKNAVAGWRDENSAINLGDAAPDAYGGNRFVGWRDAVTGQMVSDYRTTDYRFTLTGDRSFTAVFGDLEGLSTTVNDLTRGYLESDLGGMYGRGSVINLNWAQPTARTGYSFDHWEEYNSGWDEIALVGGQPIITIGDWNYFRAVFVRSESTVSFEENGGAPAIPDQTIVYNNKAARPTTAMTRTGYTFDNWYADPGCNTLFDFNKNITADTVIYANWKPNTYTVVYNANGGIGSTSSSVHTYDVAKALTPNGFTRPGYGFAAWAATPGGPAVYTNSQNVTNLTSVNAATVNLYALWTPAEYTLTYELNGGSASNPAAYTIESAAITLVNPSRTGYTFTGWTSPSFAGTLMTVVIPAGSVGNRTFTAQWSQDTYTITYDLDGGAVSAPNPTDYTVDTPDFTLTNPTKTGYTFVGWEGTSISGTTPVATIAQGSTGNKDYKAVFVPNTYTVIYDGNGAPGTMGSSGHTYDLSGQLSANTYVWPGHTFLGWSASVGGDVTYNDQQEVLNLTDEANGSVTLHAVWETIGYTITYDLDGGAVSAPNPTDYTVDTPDFTLTNPTKTGYTFVGWEGTGISGTAPVVTIAQGSTENKDYKAVFVPNTYTVIYDGNGAPGTMSSSEHTYDLSGQLSANTYVWPGHTFLGWSASVGGDVTYNDQQEVLNLTDEANGSVTLHAVWETIGYTITYDLDGGAVSAPNPTDYTVDTPDFTLINPTKTGYTFAGWEGTGINGTASVVTVTQGSTGNRDYKALWTANTYVVKYDGNSADGGATADSSHTYDAASVLTTNGFTKTGYTFAGWATSAGGAVVYSDGASVSNLTSASGGEVTLFAKWTANSYTVKYDGNSADGGTTADSSHTYDAASVLTTNGFTKTGYTFAGWATSAGGAVVYSDGASVSNLTSASGGAVTLFAKWAANGYTVKYDGNSAVGGTTASSSHVYDTASALTANGFTKAGYTFAGWATSAGDAVVYSDGASVKNLTSVSGGEVTLFAKWTANGYTVKYDGNSADGGTTADSSHTYDAASALTANGFTKAGYTFAGWAASADGAVVYGNSASVKNLASAKGGVVTLFAKWTINTFAVRFVNYDGTELGTQTVNWNTAASAPVAPVRTGYRFTGWDTDFTAVKDNLTVTAQFVIRTFAVRFVDFDGTAIGTQRVRWNDGAAAPAAPQREGYTFTGWDTSIDPVTSNLTVTAQYRINTYTVTFADYDGTVLNTQTVDWNTAAAAPADPARDGYAFTGWNGAFDAVRADTTITAQYEAVTAIDDEDIPDTGGNTIPDEPVPAAAGGSFAWWWIPIIVGAAAVLFFLIFFVVRRKKKEEENA